MDYPLLPGLTPDGTVYRNEHMGTVEAMIPPGDFVSAHAPSLLELPNGDLLCAWFAGSFEGNADISIVCARFPKGAKMGNLPFRVSNDPTRSEQNPPCSYRRTESLDRLYCTTCPGPGKGQHAVHIHYSTAKKPRWREDLD